MDKQLTSVCDYYLLRTRAGLHNFFRKTKAVFTAGTDKPWDKAEPKLSWTQFSPRSKIRARLWTQEGKHDLPPALPGAPQTQAVAEQPGHRTNAAPGRECGTGVSWKDGIYNIPPKSV